MKANRGAGSFVALVSVVLLSTAAVTGASAQGLDLSGSATMGVSRSDNIFLATSPSEEDETIFSISPALQLDYSNQRLTSFVNYRYDWYRYSELDSDSEFHQYDAGLTLDLIEDVFQVDAGGSRSQSIIDPDFSVPSSNLPISGNQTDRDEYFVNPRFEKTFAGSVTATASYRYSDVSFGDSDLQKNTNKSANAGLENYQAGEGLTWALRYQRDETDYDVSTFYEYQQATAELGFWVNGSTRVFASGGKESAWDDQVDRSLQDEFWEAGVAYRNGDKLSAEFAAGERSFGSSWRARIDSNFRRGSLSLSYAERPTTSGRTRFSRGGLLDPDEPDDFLVRAGAAERYVSERAQVTAQLEFRRTTLSVSVFDESRTNRFAADGTPRGDEDQRGVNASFNWKAGVRTEFFASGRLSTRDTEFGGEQDYLSALLGVNYRLASSVSMSLSYNHTEQQPQDGANGRDYVAGVTSFYLTYSF